MKSTHHWLAGITTLGALIWTTGHFFGAIDTRAAETPATATIDQIAPDAPAFVHPMRDGASALWGKDGQNWSDASRLPDFSHAGYENGEKPLPKVPDGISATQFGVKGDGISDDAPALQVLVDAPQQGAIRLPAGRFVLGSVVNITKPNLVLRGAGPDKTVLVIPKSLSGILGDKITSDNKSAYAFSGGFLTVKGSFGGAKLAAVSQSAKRGDRELLLSQPLKLAPGTFIRLQMSDSEHTLGRALHADVEDAGVDTYQSIGTKPWIDWAARVVKNAGNRLTLDRPLRLDVQLNWKPEIWSYQPTVTDVGIENLSFEFAGVPKLAHLKEEGFNAIQFTNVANCWVKNLRFTDGDNGVILGGSRFCTVENVEFRAQKRTGLTGHHALWPTGRSQDCLFQNFRFETRYVHDLTVEGRANGNVFRNGSGVALNFDHHRNAPYENLFTNLDVGDPSRAWQSSGRDDRGPHSGARSTFGTCARAKNSPTNRFLPRPRGHKSMSSACPTPHRKRPKRLPH